MLMGGFGMMAALLGAGLACVADQYVAFNRGYWFARFPAWERAGNDAVRGDTSLSRIVVASRNWCHGARRGKANCLEANHDGI
jgi:hypothetical protein